MSIQKPRSPPALTAYDQSGSSSSSSWRHNSFFPLPLVNKENKAEESDEDLFTVPDVEARPPQLPPPPSVDSTNTTSNNTKLQQISNSCSAKRRRARNPVDREYRKLKRLLRNRVSAQQARERKKLYVNDLESRAKELHDNNLRLQEKISTLINENTMLRKVQRCECATLLQNTVQSDVTIATCLYARE